jgi:ribonuclease HI
MHKMLDVGAKYGVRIETIAVSREAQRDMPIWHHKFAHPPNNYFYNAPKHAVNCLKTKHRVKTVRDAETLAAKLRTPRHKNRKDCKCAGCAVTRAITRCPHPNQCFKKAAEMIEVLEDKWNPTLSHPEGFEDDEPSSDSGDEESVVYFNPKVTTNSIADAFRIFENGPRNTSKAPPDVRRLDDPEEGPTVVYTDGSAIDNGTPQAKAGAGIFFGINDPRNRALRIPEALGPSNQVGELAAIKEAAEMCPRDQALHIISDSRYAIDGMTKNAQKWEDEGFMSISNGDLAKITLMRLRERRAPTSFRWIKGHDGVEGNEAADELAGQGAAADIEDEIRMQTDSAPRLLKSGAKLQALSQSLAGKIIRKTKMETPAYREKLARGHTRRNLAMAQAAAAPETLVKVTEKKIWMSVRHTDFARNVRYFLWMTVHDGYKVGLHWKNLVGYEDRGTCDRCDDYETMEHILTRCFYPGQEEVWELASELWKLKTGRDLRPVISQIMACGATEMDDAGETRLFRIIVSESAYLIWLLRCDRRINQKPPASRAEITRKWLWIINNRLQIDREMTNTNKYGRKALPLSLVKKTWSRTLKNEKELPDDWPSWSRGIGVLVGVG